MKPALSWMARVFDGVLSRCVVERRFVARRPDLAIPRLAEQRTRLEALSGSDWFPQPPLLEPTHTTEGRYRGRPTKTIQWRAPALAVATRLDVAVATRDPQATIISDSDRGSDEIDRAVPPHTRASSERELAVGKRPIWILVHGWLGGTLLAARLDWPLDELLRDGDLCHFVLPGHGARRAPRRPSERAAAWHRIGIAWPSFPARNPLSNAVGLATATAELRQLVTWLRGIGYDRIGVAGTSIGANVVGLFATTGDDVERVLLDRPLVCMSEPLRRYVARREKWRSSASAASHPTPHERSGAEWRQVLALLESLYFPVDLLSRPIRLPRERVDVLSGCADAIAGARLGEELAQRWGAVPRHFVGGHLLPFGRSPVLRALLQKLWSS